MPEGACHVAYLPKPLADDDGDRVLRGRGGQVLQRAPAAGNGAGGRLPRARRAQPGRLRPPQEGRRLGEEGGQAHRGGGGPDERGRARGPRRAPRRLQPGGRDPGRRGDRRSGSRSGWGGGGAGAGAGGSGGGIGTTTLAIAGGAVAAGVLVAVAAGGGGEDEPTAARATSSPNPGTPSWPSTPRLSAWWKPSSAGSGLTLRTCVGGLCTNSCSAFYLLSDGRRFNCSPLPNCDGTGGPIDDPNFCLTAAQQAVQACN